MSAIDGYLRQLDDAWRHRWESLRPALDGVTEEEAAWQAACYRHEPVKSGWPRPGTIHWHVAHLEACKREYTAAMVSQGPGGQAEAAAPATTFAEAVERLARAHAAQREVIRSLSEGDLTRLVQDGMRLDEFLASTIRHDTWHAAQIAVVRRLWRTREGQAGPS